ncbi:MAG TPA: DUF2924 domain-containing protein [Gemmataceae bacterium]|nr:DUF2924 domain-containing protein [Gemmataceae bacterium]
MNIVNEVAALQRLNIAQLRQRFAEVFGEATNASNRTWLIKRIAWRMQALAEGDLSERARHAPPSWPATPTYDSTRPNRQSTLQGRSPRRRTTGLDRRRHIRACADAVA